MSYFHYFIVIISALLVTELMALFIAFLIGIIFAVSIPYTKVMIFAAVIFVIHNVIRLAINSIFDKGEEGAD